MQLLYCCPSQLVLPTPVIFITSSLSFPFLLFPSLLFLFPSLPILHRTLEESVGVDLEAAFSFYKASADQGIPEAQNNLGIMFEEGLGTEQDLDQALYWYQKASESGNADAIFNIGSLFEKGLAVPRDLEEAFQHYTLVSRPIFYSFLILFPKPERTDISFLSLLLFLSLHSFLSLLSFPDNNSSCHPQASRMGSVQAKIRIAQEKNKKAR